MTSYRLRELALAASLAVAFATPAMAQTEPQQDQTAPKAASSPHQREATSTQAAEAPAATQTDPTPAAASSPHQKSATEGKMAAGKTSAERDRMMGECVKKEQARNSSTTAEQAKKTCTDKMTNATKDRY